MRKTNCLLQKALSVAIILTLSGSVSTACLAGPEYQRHFDLGKDFLQRQEYKLAVQELSLAVAKPASPVELSAAFVDRGTAYSELKDYAKASADLDHAIALDPKSHLAYNNRGVVYLRQMMADKAIADFDRAIALDPNDKYAVVNRAGAYLMSAKPAQLAVNTENWIVSKNWKSDFAAQAAVLTILAYRLGGDNARAQQLTQTALKSLDKLPWPYQMVQFFAHKADKEKVFEAAQDSTYDLMQGECYLGLDFYIGGKQNYSQAREKFNFVTKHGTANSVEYWVGKYFLTRVEVPVADTKAPKAAVPGASKQASKTTSKATTSGH